MVAPPEESGTWSCPQNAERLPWIGNPVRSRNSTRCCKSYIKSVAYRHWVLHLRRRNNDRDKSEDQPFFNADNNAYGIMGITIQSIIHGHSRQEKIHNPVRSLLVCDVSNGTIHFKSIITNEQNLYIFSSSHRRTYGCRTDTVIRDRHPRPHKSHHRIAV